MNNKKITRLSVDDIKDVKVSWFVGAYFISSTANMTMKTILPIPESMWGMVSLFWGIIIMFFMLRGIRTVILRSKNLIMKSLVVFFILFSWSYFLITLREEPTSVLSRNIGIPALIFWLPVGIYVCSVKRVEILYHILLKTSYVITALLILCFLFRNGVAVSGEEARSYNMFFGYSMAFSSLFQLNEFHRTRKNFFLLLFLFQVVLILLYANRGALLSVGFYIVYKLVVDQGSTLMKVIWITLIVLSLSALMFYMEDLASAAVRLLDSYNIQSRTLEKMAMSEVAESDSRDELRAIAIQMINERPILGWGIGGECYTLGMRYMPVAGLSVGFSPHNGILQHMLYFGFILGNIVNLLLIVPLFKLHKIRDEYRHALILICGSAYFITTLWTSCDILIKPAVAIYIYLSYINTKQKRVQEKIIIINIGLHMHIN